MTDAGLVIRSSELTDQRAAVLQATPLARRLLRDYDTASEALLAKAIAELDECDRAALEQGVGALRRLLEKLRPGNGTPRV
ncbi:hypothetical protein [Mycobacteroides abscessus]